MFARLLGLEICLFVCCILVGTHSWKKNYKLSINLDLDLSFEWILVVDHIYKYYYIHVFVCLCGRENLWWYDLFFFCFFSFWTSFSFHHKPHDIIKAMDEQKSRALIQNYLDSSPHEELQKHLTLQPFQYKGLVDSINCHPDERWYLNELRNRNTRFCCAI